MERYIIKEKVEVPNNQGLNDTDSIMEALCTEGAFDDLLSEDK